MSSANNLVRRIHYDILAYRLGFLPQFLFHNLPAFSYLFHKREIVQRLLSDKVGTYLIVSTGCKIIADSCNVGRSGVLIG